jgi:hypothetical protein
VAVVIAHVLQHLVRPPGANLSRGLVPVAP